MPILLQQLINGFFTGNVYELFAIGYPLVFVVSDILNLAHAAIFTLGGLTALWLICVVGPAPLVVRFIFDFIRKPGDEGQTIVLVEQNARQALAISSCAYVIESGRVVLKWQSDQLQSDPAITGAYLGRL